LIRSPFRDLPREVSSLVAASFFVAVGFGIVMPAIPVFAKSFGVNNAAIGVMVSAFAITRFASGLISGVLVDKFGERAVFHRESLWFRPLPSWQAYPKATNSYYFLEQQVAWVLQCFPLQQVQ
jgi:MFS family permease